MPNVEQRSPEWYEARRGKVTASRIADVMATIKSGGYGASRANYMAQLICERLTGTVGDGYESHEMIRGRELEPEARAAYGFTRGVEVYPGPGFVDHPEIAMTGASPDGIVTGGGLVEFKIPNTATHIQ